MTFMFMLFVFYVQCDKYFINDATVNSICIIVKCPVFVIMTPRFFGVGGLDRYDVIMWRSAWCDTMSQGGGDGGKSAEKSDIINE